MPKEFIDKCQAQVDSISNELNAIANGEKWCNEDASEWYGGPDMETDETGELHQAGMYDYFDNNEILDIEFRIGSDSQYRSASACIVMGGPSICIDTEIGAVMLYWDSTTCKSILNRNAVHLLDSYFEEMMEAYRR